MASFLSPGFLSFGFRWTDRESGKKVVIDKTEYDSTMLVTVGYHYDDDRVTRELSTLSFLEKFSADGYATLNGCAVWKNEKELFYVKSVKYLLPETERIVRFADYSGNKMELEITRFISAMTPEIVYTPGTLLRKDGGNTYLLVEKIDNSSARVVAVEADSSGIVISNVAQRLPFNHIARNYHIHSFTGFPVIKAERVSPEDQAYIAIGKAVLPLLKNPVVLDALAALGGGEVVCGED